METLIENVIENEVITLITRNQMIGLFMGVKNPEMINLSTETIPKMKKGGNPYFEQIVKKSKCNYLLCTNYSKRVNVNRGKEGKETDFKSQSSWYQNLLEDNNYLICNKKDETKTYIKGIVNKTENLFYSVDGVEATKEQLVDIELYKPKTSAPTNQGTETPILIRTFSIDGLNSIIVDEVEYSFI
jgi:hypothetical protein